LHVFLEGQYHGYSAQEEFLKPSQSTELISDSYQAWKSVEFSNINTITSGTDTSAVIESFRAFRSAQSLPLSAEIEDIARRHLEFYMSMDERGDLNPAAGLMKFAVSTPDGSPLNSRVQGLKPNDASFSKYLFEHAQLRGALAYKLYVEGNPQVSGVADRVRLS